MKKLFNKTQTWLECILCGRKKDLLEERKFRCVCGGLYDVKHNLECPLPYVLKKDFYERLELHQSISGVWRYKELIMPYLPKRFVVSLSEGNVPIIEAGRNLEEWVGGDLELWLILEGMTPTGSFKDFGMTVLISVAKAAGIEAVSCASTGDTSASAAAYAAAAGMKCVVILPRGKVTPAQLAQPLVHGATVITLPGSFDDCMKVQRELTEKYGVYPANSLNPARIEGHQATVFQVAQFFNWDFPDWFVVPVGNGSNCSSIGKARRLLLDLKMAENNCRILGCQSLAANPLAESWGRATWKPQERNSKEFLEYWKMLYAPVAVRETTATAARIGDPVSRDKVMREIVASNGRMKTATERDLNEAVSVCGKDGFFVCPQTGIALAGLREAVKEKTINPGSRVVVVSTATGLKFTDSAAKNLAKNIIDAKNCKTDTVARIMKI
ncbi:MAG: threonine synthase [Candidatus Pacebacteria bacterium]|nr:threonine synthase [Candidatus Paceibacterota bacterium]